MKATTLILLVFVGLGLWFLYNYMNQKSKTVQIIPAPSGVATDTGITDISGPKPVGAMPDVLAEAGRDIILQPIASAGPVPVLTARPGTMTFIV